MAAPATESVVVVTFGVGRDAQPYRVVIVDKSEGRRFDPPPPVVFFERRVTDALGMDAWVSGAPRHEDVQHALAAAVLALARHRVAAATTTDGAPILPLTYDLGAIKSLGRGTLHDDD